jgi:hypothetical protein
LLCLYVLCISTKRYERVTMENKSNIAEHDGREVPGSNLGSDFRLRLSVTVVILSSQMLG